MRRGESLCKAVGRIDSELTYLSIPGACFRFDSGNRSSVSVDV